jgi:hypothetical protein
MRLKILYTRGTGTKTADLNEGEKNCTIVHCQHDMICIQLDVKESAGFVI